MQARYRSLKALPLSCMLEALASAVQRARFCDQVSDGAAVAATVESAPSRVATRSTPAIAIVFGMSVVPLQSMSRKSGYRFSDQDMRQLNKLGRGQCSTNR